MGSRVQICKNHFGLIWSKLNPGVGPCLGALVFCAIIYFRAPLLFDSLVSMHAVILWGTSATCNKLWSWWQACCVHWWYIGLVFWLHISLNVIVNCHQSPQLPHLCLNDAGIIWDCRTDIWSDGLVIKMGIHWKYWSSYICRHHSPRF